MSAAAYRVLTECEPQIADALLTSLAQDGIAAYAVPYEGSIGGYLEVHPPERPLARVWVDARAVEAARRVLDARYAVPPVPPAEAEHEAWQEIVAALRRPGPDGPVPWPAAEATGPHSAGRPPDKAAGSLPARPLAGAPSPDPPPGTAEPAEDLESQEDHFVPPPPPPVPVPRGPSAYGIAAVIGGCAVLLVPTMAGDPVSPALLVLAIVAIVGGFLTLVAGMRQGPPTDSDPDDGAVI